jgi:hypothetical protein
MKNLEKFNQKLSNNYLSKIYGGDSYETVETSGFCYTDSKTTRYDNNCKVISVCTTTHPEKCA